MGAGSRKICIISMDHRQGYHQVSIKVVDRDKLEFSTPDNQKYAFYVVPFGPTNAPGFYSAMMKNFKDEWDMLFIQLLHELKTIRNKPVVVTETDEIFIGTIKLVSGSRTIIGDILLFCINLDAILLCLECVWRVFQKYCVIIWLDKCDLLNDSIECVGHDVTDHVNCPAQSKLYLINNWWPPKNIQALFLFIGLVNSYHQYSPYFEI